MKLQRLFERYNQRYFGGRLTDYHVIQSDRFGGDGICRSKQREIHIQGGLKGITLRRTLIHEMAHAATPKDHNHGPIWMAEMRRLARLGAPTTHDIRMYSAKEGIHNSMLGAKELISQAEDAGMEIGTAPDAWINYRNSECYRNGLVDKHGRAESSHAKSLLRRIKAAFYRGVHDKIRYEQDSKEILMHWRTS